MKRIIAQVGGKHDFEVVHEQSPGRDWYEVNFQYEDSGVSPAYGSGKEKAISAMETFISEAESALAYLRGM